MKKWSLLIDTKDEKGLIHKITGVLFYQNLNVLQTKEFVDNDNNRFYMRCELEGDVNQEAILQKLEELIPAAKLSLCECKRKDIVIMVTKESHAIGDILIKHEFGDLNANIKAVIGNHKNLQDLVEKFNIPYIYVSHEDKSREQHEQEIRKVIDSYAPDFVVLAKYMRILTSDFIAGLENKIINIHHSFLPAFIGANPYKQAHQRGVKIIGATAHFVNNDLDEGPIIYQNVVPVDHTMTWQDMMSLGRDVEKTVLSNALKLVFEDKVFVYQNKTVIL
ncbi:MAG: formyltetrahydrofolate deformylase [Gammaproteobacteria bacterium]|nr:formyltetrahydrofolate deformylase [Gammaproteobacteria bacterium]